MASTRVPQVIEDQDGIESVTKQIWEGIYDSFEKVPLSGDGHDGSTWTAKSVEKMHNLQSLAQLKGSIPKVPEYNSTLLPLLAALVLKERGKATILDFGGGLGFTYLAVAAAIPASGKLDYHIVETQNICTAGEKAFARDPCIHFHSSLPTSIEAADIVHLGSSLQYIDDWRGLLKNLAGYSSLYFIFTDLTAGDIPSYVTAQNYYGAKIPARFFNIDEIYDAMGKNGYQQIFRSTFKGTYFGVVQKLPQDNLPERFRLGDTCSLVFGRDSARDDAPVHNQVRPR